MKICRCCGRSMENSEMKCTRCGCQYVNTLDDDAENRDSEMPGYEKQNHTS